MCALFLLSVSTRLDARMLNLRCAIGIVGLILLFFWCLPLLPLPLLLVLSSLQTRRSLEGKGIAGALGSLWAKMTR